VDGQRRADGRGHRLLDQERLSGAGAPGCLEYCALLDVRDRRRYANEHARPVEARHTRTLEQHAEEAFGDLEVRDRAAAKGPDGNDVPGRAADHLPRLVTDGEHLVGAVVERDDRRLVDDDAFVA
jgi:hypothetical protein